MNDSIIISSKTTSHSKFWVFAIVLLILTISGGYYLWLENNLSIQSFFPIKEKVVKIYDTRQELYNSRGQTVVFKCIVSIKYDDNPTSYNFFSSYDDEQKFLENCIPL